MTAPSVIRHQTYAEIDVSIVRANIRLLKAAIGPARKLMLVVKSDAYGHGAGAIASIASEEGVRNFAVASVNEGIQLRRVEITGEILLLHPPFESEFPAVLEWHLTPAITSEEMATMYNRLAGGAVLPVQIEINTGLSRLGLNWNTAADSIARIASLDHLKITGIYTHYRAHYSPKGDSIAEQTGRFNQVIQNVEQRGIDPGFRHAASSYPAAFHPVTMLDGIRVGVVAFGTIEQLPPPLTGIRPVMSVRSCILHLRRINAGEWVHYGDGFHAARDMSIAVIPIGYGMGYPRHLSNNGEMLIRGQRCPIVGVIGMDLTMLDVSSLADLKVGEPVTVLGRDGDAVISALEIANRVGTIAYEITCRLGNGLPRYVVNQQSTSGELATMARDFSS